MYACTHVKAANTCPKLSGPSYGYVKYTGIYRGSQATYFCRDGYRLKGEGSRTCQSNGLWTGEKPSCVRKYEKSQVFSCCRAHSSPRVGLWWSRYPQKWQKIPKRIYFWVSCQVLLQFWLPSCGKLKEKVPVQWKMERISTLLQTWDWGHILVVSMQLITGCLSYYIQLLIAENLGILNMDE